MDKKILIVEDEYSINEIHTLTFKKEGYDVRSTFDGNGALAELERFNPDMILLDSRTVDVHVGRVRAKLGLEKDSFIETVFGKGYVMR